MIDLAARDTGSLKPGHEVVIGALHHLEGDVLGDRQVGRLQPLVDRGIGILEKGQRAAILELALNQKQLEATPVHEFVDMMVI